MLAHSLLVRGFHLCIYCMEGYCVHGTPVPLCSINNKTMVQRPGVLEISSFTVLYCAWCCTISFFNVIDDRLPTFAICNQPAKRLVISLSFSCQQRQQRRRLGEKLLPMGCMCFINEKNCVFVYTKRNI